MFFVVLILVVVIMAAILIFSNQEDGRPTVEQSVNPSSASKEDEEDYDDLSYAELSSAALEHVHHLTSYTFSENAAQQRLLDIADYRKRVEKISSDRVRRAYNEWLDYAEKRQKEELENYEKRRNTKKNAQRIPKP